MTVGIQHSTDTQHPDAILRFYPYNPDETPVEPRILPFIALKTA